MEILQDFADALGRRLPGGKIDPADCETPWGFELGMSPFGDVWPGHRTKRPLSYIDGFIDYTKCLAYVDCQADTASRIV